MSVLAQSGHRLVQCTCPLSDAKPTGGKRPVSPVFWLFALIFDFPAKFRSDTWTPSREFCLQLHSLRQAHVPWFATTLRLASVTNIRKSPAEVLAVTALSETSVPQKRSLRSAIRMSIKSQSDFFH